MNRRIVVLSSDTLHHRYFINTLLGQDIPLLACYFETTHVEPPFPVGPLYEELEREYEREMFFRESQPELLTEDVHEVENTNDPEVVAALRELEPDLGVVFGTRKLSRQVLDCFADGLINVHRGIAQAYRGLDSELWAIYHRDWDNIGVTIHLVEPRLDTGNIVAQERLPLRRGMKIHQLRYETTLIATRLVARTLRDYLQGRLEGRPQEELGRYYSFMPLDIKRLMQRRFDRYCESLG